MDNTSTLLQVALLGLVMALGVFGYNYLAPSLLGRPRCAIQAIDIAFLGLFLTLLIFILRASGLWARLMGNL